MSDEYDVYPPGLDWIGFIRKFAKFNNLTHAQAVHAGRAHYHAYKVEDLRAQQQRQPAAAPPRPQKPKSKPVAVPSGKKSSRDPVEDEYQQFLQWRAGGKRPERPERPEQHAPEKKQRKKKVIYVTDSEDEDDE